MGHRLRFVAAALALIAGLAGCIIVSDADCGYEGCPAVTLTCGGGDCVQTCPPDQDCLVKCGGGDCDIYCAGTSYCDIHCGGGDCDVSCTDDAFCDVHCGGGDCSCAGEGCPAGDPGEDCWTG